MLKKSFIASSWAAAAICWVCVPFIVYEAVTTSGQMAAKGMTIACSGLLAAMITGAAYLVSHELKDK